MNQVYGKETTMKTGTFKKRIKDPIDDKIFFIAVYIIVTLFTLVVAYPIIYILSSSFSSPGAVLAGKIILWPVDFSLEGYKAVFKYPPVFTGYRNTFFYAAAGTLINVCITVLAAYPLARKKLPYRNFLMFIFAFTMMFNGGMIPNYILLRDLKMLNTIWAMLLPGALAVYNMIITRTFIQSSIPEELLEAAKIDGCSDFKYLFYIILPLAKPVIAVITLFYAVGHWNSYFDAMLYLNKETLYPLQIILRDILILNTIDMNTIQDVELALLQQGLSNLLKYSLIVVSTVPILCLYPFVQKYFIKGVMIGAIKG